ncbi:MAG: helix-turn-helix domain-containing protein [Caldilineaceae bacterium]|nr:helix-turn-helix domain-containing protein [Caldilineaceae bacterium]
MPQAGLRTALYDKPRLGAKPRLTGEVEAQLIMLACSAPLKGQSRWTLRSLVQRLVELKLVESVSQRMIYAIALASHTRLPLKLFRCA